MHDFWYRTIKNLYAIQEFHLHAANRIIGCVYVPDLDWYRRRVVWCCSRDFRRCLRDNRSNFRWYFWRYRGSARLDVSLGLAIWRIFSLEPFHYLIHRDCGSDRKPVPKNLIQATGCLLYKSLFKKYFEYIGYFLTSRSSGFVRLTNTTLY